MKCDKCGTPLMNAPGIGPFCPNKECDVVDNTSGAEPIKFTLIPPTPIVPDNVTNMWADPRFQLLADVDKLLNGNKVWGGTEWSYGYIHPFQYRPVAEKVRKALDDLYAEYGVKDE